MKPYKGIVRIECRRKGKCPQKLRENVRPGCMDCPDGAVCVLDLDGKVVFTVAGSRLPVKKTVNRKP